MREIKYRAWDIRNKIMIYDAIVATETQSLLTTTLDIQNPFAHFDGVKWMQSIGRNDVDGNPIYEDDILYIEFENSKFLNVIEPHLVREFCHVVWLEDKMRYSIPDVESRFRAAMASAIMNEDKPTPQWKIVGNIYMNPELVIPE